MPAGQSAQILQQIEGLLAQLAQEEPEPQIQQAVDGILKQVQPLQQLVGQDDEQDMQSGLANPGGALGGAEGEGGGAAAALEAGGNMGNMPGPMPAGGGEDSGGGEPIHAMEVHIKAAPKTFAGARKAAMANHAEKGHFNPHGEKGESQQTSKTKQRLKR